MPESDQIIIGRTDSPIPTDWDVRLSVFLHGARFDFAACLTAALAFIEEWRHTPYFDAVDLCFDGAETLPRLPNERLYLEP
ncbi:hypothetical protein [Nocardia altamirensis]|uniref:hypothetical protein n=1 Tax=Nocardia altamirensis TaxID=472158 RepID=UPI00083FFE96|nr:hypothetical protein [Nocardia altamirensis]